MTDRELYPSKDDETESQDDIIVVQTKVDGDVVISPDNEAIIITNNETIPEEVIVVLPAKRPSEHQRHNDSVRSSISSIRHSLFGAKENSAGPNDSEIASRHSDVGKRISISSPRHSYHGENENSAAPNDSEIASRHSDVGKRISISSPRHSYHGEKENSAAPNDSEIASRHSDVGKRISISSPRHTYIGENENSAAPNDSEIASRHIDVGKRISISSPRHSYHVEKENSAAPNDSEIASRHSDVGKRISISSPSHSYFGVRETNTAPKHTETAPKHSESSTKFTLRHSDFSPRYRNDDDPDQFKKKQQALFFQKVAVENIKYCSKCKRPGCKGREKHFVCSKNILPKRDSFDFEDPDPIIFVSAGEYTAQDDYTENTNPNARHSHIRSCHLSTTPIRCDMCLYRTAIEKWQPLRGALYCPKCHFTETPLIRTKTKKSTETYSIFGTNCMLHCWPLCFIPYLFPPRSRHYLHCAECFNFLGVYDQRNKCIQPNQEFLDSDGCYSAQRSK